MIVASVNAGSSVVRVALHDGARRPPVRLRSERLEAGEPRPAEALSRVLAGRPVAAVAHRVVHGGGEFTGPVVVDRRVEERLARLSSLAPLHNPVALAWLSAAREALGDDVPQVAVFDTAFFAGLPEEAALYALPRDLARRHGIRRHGFHGLAHASLLRSFRALRPDLPGGGRLVTMQLGSGCSLAALHEGRPLDTTMGFSPLEGLVMATRPGDVDPGALLHLLEAGIPARELGELLNRRSGLLGLSGTSGRMEELLASREPAAATAVDVFCHRARRHLGGMLAVLRGADAVVVGGGIGEHAPAVRAAILGPFAWCGLHLDEAANAEADGATRLTRPGSPVEAWVLPVDESAELAGAALAAVAGG